KLRRGVLSPQGTSKIFVPLSPHSLFAPSLFSLFNLTTLPRIVPLSFLWAEVDVLSLSWKVFSPSAWIDIR
ncbi:MAG: hypothetical protein LBS22_02455, partial [Puniceicoccales bacterium]|nr:hypothetical protein [Puniceicoccales bacterium]